MASVYKESSEEYWGSGREGRGKSGWQLKHDESTVPRLRSVEEMDTAGHWIGGCDLAWPKSMS